MERKLTDIMHACMEREQKGTNLLRVVLLFRQERSDMKHDLEVPKVRVDRLRARAAIRLQAAPGMRRSR